LINPKQPSKFRIVYTDDLQLHYSGEANATTVTIHNVEHFDTSDEMLNRINELGIKQEDEVSI